MIFQPETGKVAKLSLPKQISRQLGGRGKVRSLMILVLLAMCPTNNIPPDLIDRGQEIHRDYNRQIVPFRDLVCGPKSSRQRRILYYY